MNRQEQKQFIAEQLQGLWPQWDATDAELQVWMSDLATLDYAAARAAAQACFREQGANYHRPVLGKFLAKARALSRPAGGRRTATRDVETDVFIECREPPPGRACWSGLRKPVYVHPPSKQDDPDYVLSCAHALRTQFERLYGGSWIVVCTAPAPA